jgi:hypothetical protein
MPTTMKMILLGHCAKGRQHWLRKKQQPPFAGAHGRVSWLCSRKVAPRTLCAFFGVVVFSWPLRKRKQRATE